VRRHLFGKIKSKSPARSRALSFDRSDEKSERAEVIVQAGADDVSGLVTELNPFAQAQAEIVNADE
jgi:hypothetical protein